MTRFEDVLQEFLAYLKVELGSAENTISAYRGDLRDLSRFLTDNGVDDVQRVELSHLTAWLKDLVDREFATSSIGRKIAAVRMLWRHLAETLQVRDLGNLLDAPKVGRKIPLVPRPEQIDAMVAAVRNRPRMCWRDRALLELFFASGLRVEELANVRTADIDLQAKTIRVIGKGNKERLVLFSEPALAAMKMYLSEVRGKLAKGNDTPLLFLSRTGKQLDRHNIYRLVVKLAKRAGIATKVSPHTLRHAFATHLHAGGADLRVIQDLLGHESILTTEKYVHIDPSRLKAIHQKCHPLDNGLGKELEAIRQQRQQQATQKDLQATNEAPTLPTAGPAEGSASSEAGNEA